MFFKAQPVAGAVITLSPVGNADPANWPSGYPRGTVAPDGSFRIGTFADEDGAPPGDYVMLVSWATAASDSDNASNDPEAAVGDALNGKYCDPATSQLPVKVTAPATDLARIDLK
jgi:hypothetical protein